MSQRKTPCDQCPFRKKSLRGYLGPHADTTEIVNILYRDEKFPCHKETTAISEFLETELSDPDDSLSMSEDAIFRQAVREAPHCAGALIMLNNSCKLSRNREIATVQNMVGKSKDVFANKAEMEKWHEGDKTLVAARKKMLAGM